MLKFVLVFCLANLVSAFIYDDYGRKISTNCDFGTNIYQELGCKPIRNRGSTCPKTYECPKYEVKPHSCRHLGVYYKEGETIRNTWGFNINSVCNVDPKSGVGYVVGPAIDLNWEQINNTCYKKCHDIEVGFFHDIVCEPYGDIARCESDERTYLEGQIFDPKGTCWSCLCQKGYNGTPKEPFCKRRQCDMELHFPEQLVKKCAPIYYRRIDQCCPSSFLCPEDVSSIHVVGGNRGGLECTLGEHKIPVGGKFDTVKRDPEYSANYDSGTNLTCSCDVPPWPSCYMNGHIRLYA